MKKSAHRRHPRVIGMAAACALGVSAAVITAPAATAADCTASGLSTVAGGVLAEAGGYLAAHPGANNVLTAAATQPPDVARTNVRGYFTSNPGEFLDLRRIAASTAGSAQPVRYRGQPGTARDAVRHDVRSLISAADGR